MARPIHKLTARKIASLDFPGRHSDGGRIVFQSPQGWPKTMGVYVAREWPPKRDGSGRVSNNLASRCQKRNLQRLENKWPLGLDPIRERAVTREIPTFGIFADQFINDIAGSFRNKKHTAQWRMTLGNAYCKSIRSKPIDQISIDDIEKILKPIWVSKNETASRLRGRIERVLDAASAKKLRMGENPARWKGVLEPLLGKVKKAEKHFAAMPYPDLPVFMGKLATLHSHSARALAFLILTASRSGEVLGARWSEVNMKETVWIVPANRMKASREHVVPLSIAAMSVLREMAQIRENNDNFVFPGTKSGSGLSDMSLTMLLRRQKLGQFTVHGFRSSFRDWAGDETTYAREIAEAALAHRIGDAAEQAYRRGSALNKRREMMQDWSNFLVSELRK